jgi:DNA-nicking Smr family endonuclease
MSIPEIDFHLISHNDTKARFEEFINDAVKSGAKQCRIIHGKGNSQKKLQIYRYLEAHPGVYSYDDDGSNWGATIVELIHENPQE